MKKQIVAILVAIAVITTLLSVSVLSQEDYKDDLWKYQQTVMNEEKRLTSEKTLVLQHTLQLQLPHRKMSLEDIE